MRFAIAFGATVSLLAVAALADPPGPPLPSDAEITRNVRRLLHDPNIEASHCLAERESPSNAVTVRCTQTECTDGCQVIRVTSTFRIRRAGWVLVSQARVNHGDTGACGDCMMKPR